MDITGGRGVDVVVEVGGSGTVPQSVKAVAWGGCISMIGVLTASPIATIFIGDVKGYFDGPTGCNINPQAGDDFSREPF